jgi:two-component system chemotaxis response regulator CheY
MKKVLIVDDSPSVRKEVAQALGKVGYQVIEAVDGADGIIKIDREQPAAVICDVNMPRMNGLDMLEAVRREPRHASLPIVMLTSEGQPALIERAKKAGARGWIVKPFRTDLLVAAVASLVPA